MDQPDPYEIVRAAAAKRIYPLPHSRDASIETQARDVFFRWVYWDRAIELSCFQDVSSRRLMVQSVRESIARKKARGLEKLVAGLPPGPFSAAEVDRIAKRHALIETFALFEQADAWTIDWEYASVLERISNVQVDALRRLESLIAGDGDPTVIAERLERVQTLVREAQERADEMLPPLAEVQDRLRTIRQDLESVGDNAVRIADWLSSIERPASALLTPIEVAARAGFGTSPKRTRYFRAHWEPTGLGVLLSLHPSGEISYSLEEEVAQSASLLLVDEIVDEARDQLERALGRTPRSAQPPARSPFMPILSWDPPLPKDFGLLD